MRRPFHGAVWPHRLKVRLIIEVLSPAAPAPAHALGWLAVAIAAVPHLRDAGGWPLAFGLLAVGPALGIVAMRRLGGLRSTGRGS